MARLLPIKQRSGNDTVAGFGRLSLLLLNLNGFGFKKINITKTSHKDLAVTTAGQLY